MRQAADYDRSVPTCVPAQHPARAQRVPAIRLTDGAGELLMKRVAVSHVESPAAIWLAAVAHERDGLIDVAVRLHAGRAQIVERAQHVIVPECRKRELRPRRLDDLPGRQPAKQATLEEVRLRAS